MATLPALDVYGDGHATCPDARQDVPSTQAFCSKGSYPLVLLSLSRSLSLYLSRSLAFSLSLSTSLAPATLAANRTQAKPENPKSQTRNLQPPNKYEPASEPLHILGNAAQQTENVQA